MLCSSRRIFWYKLGRGPIFSLQVVPYSCLWLLHTQREHHFQSSSFLLILIGGGYGGLLASQGFTKDILKVFSDEIRTVMKTKCLVNNGKKRLLLNPLIGSVSPVYSLVYWQSFGFVTQMSRCRNFSEEVRIQVFTFFPTDFIHTSAISTWQHDLVDSVLLGLKAMRCSLLLPCTMRSWPYLDHDCTYAGVRP